MAGLLYLAMLWRHRQALQLDVLLGELKRKNRRERQGARPELIADARRGHPLGCPRLRFA